MRAEPLASMLKIWASACLGFALYLLLSLLPQSSVSIALVSQLSWLALVGSIPAALVVGVASRLGRGSAVLIAVSAVAVLLLSMSMGWEHTDFLLSGPRWILHPQRRLVRIGMLLAVSALGVGGWLWLVLGTRLRMGARLAAWVTLSVTGVILFTATIVRYRAYDYSMAQLVFPAGTLCGATLYLLVRDSRRWTVVLGAAALCLLLGAGSRLVPSLGATGQRELIARSRAGALATLYVLPRFAHEEAWAPQGDACPDPKPQIEDSPIGIGPQQRRNVIIVTVDALRRDVVDAEVKGRPVAPQLSSLASAGISFTNATSPYPATLFAVGSAFTGLSPAELYLSPAVPDTIFTRSRTRVDRQLAILPDVSWFRLPIVGEFLAPGVETAFAHSDTAATDALIESLRRARRDDNSIMAWVHYYSPHDPYVARDEFAFGKGKRNAYLSEVAYFDHELGRLMLYLDEDGWLDDSLLIFFSDHGEALGEKSYWGHHVYLNAWMIDVPLLLRHAELQAAERHVGVSLADVAPTVLHFLGLPIPSDIAAQSLFTLDPELAGRASFSEAFPVRGQALFDSFRLPALDDATIRARLRSIRVASKGYEPKVSISSDRYRLIRHRSAGTWVFYDHQTDPSERSPGGTEEASKLLESELERWERDQLRRIECRLQLSDARPGPPHPR